MLGLFICGFLLSLVSFCISIKEYLLCILTSFRVLRATESWSNYFFSAVFKLFCSFFTFFSDFTYEINKKCPKINNKIKNQQKKDKFKVPPQGANQHLHVGQLWRVDKNGEKMFLFSFRYFFMILGLTSFQVCSTRKLVEIHNRHTFAV